MNTMQIGVNTKLENGTAERYLPMLQWLGVTEVRDHAFVGQTRYASEFALLAEAGVRLCAITGKADPSPTVAWLAQLERANPNFIAAVEGPNEVNNFPFAYEGKTGTPAALSYQLDLFRAALANPILDHEAILNFTDNPLPAGTCDFNNWHFYPHQAPLISKLFDTVLLRLQRVLPNHNIYITETGFTTMGGDPHQVSEDQQADQLMQVIELAEKSGVIPALYVYQLVDEPFSPNTPLLTGGFGLFRADGTPKPAAQALKAYIAGQKGS